MDVTEELESDIGVDGDGCIQLSGCNVCGSMP